MTDKLNECAFLDFGSDPWRHGLLGNGTGDITLALLGRLLRTGGSRRIREAEVMSVQYFQSCGDTGRESSETHLCGCYRYNNIDLAAAAERIFVCNVRVTPRLPCTTCFMLMLNLARCFVEYQGLVKKEGRPAGFSVHWILVLKSCRQNARHHRIWRAG